MNIKEGKRKVIRLGTVGGICLPVGWCKRVGVKAGDEVLVREVGRKLVIEVVEKIADLSR